MAGPSVCAGKAWDVQSAHVCGRPAPSKKKNEKLQSGPRSPPHSSEFLFSPGPSTPAARAPSIRIEDYIPGTPSIARPAARLSSACALVLTNRTPWPRRCGRAWGRAGPP